MNGENRTPEDERRDQYKTPRRTLSRHSTLRAKKQTLKRSELRRKKFLPRGSRLPSKNAKRAKKRKKEGKVYGSYHVWVASLPCILAHNHECMKPVVGHHLKRVKSGGQDEGNEVPACVRAHDELHWSEVKVEARYHVDLHATADKLRALWRAMNHEEAV